MRVGSLTLFLSFYWRSEPLHTARWRLKLWGFLACAGAGVTRENVFHAVQRMIVDFEAFVFSGSGGFIGPLGVLEFIRHHRQPRSQKNLIVLKILTGGFGANLAALLIGEQVDPVEQTFLFKL